MLHGNTNISKFTQIYIFLCFKTDAHGWGVGGVRMCSMWMWMWMWMWMCPMCTFQTLKLFILLPHLTLPSAYDDENDDENYD